MKTPRSSLRTLTFQSIGTCCTAALLLLSACDSAEKTAITAPPPMVTASKPIFGVFTDSDNYTGRLSAADDVDLRSRVTGYLKEIHFEPGSFVQAGDLLITIDKSTYQAVANAAAADLESAKASEALAKATLERNKPLIEQGVISQQEYDVLAAEYTAAQAATLGSQANLESAQLNLDFTEIKAPVAGRISNCPADPGDLVNANTTLLGTIVSQDPIYAYFNVDENTLVRFKRERPAEAGKDKQTLKARNIPVKMALGDSSDYSFEGVLDYSDPSIDANTGTVRVRAVFDNTERQLIPGLFVRIQIPAAESREVVQIPLRAIGTDQDRKFAYVIGASGEVEYRELTIGSQTTTLAVIEKGLDKDDMVVIDGILRLRPGVKPETKPADLSQFTKAAAAETAPAQVSTPAESAPTAEASTPAEQPAP